ncbi:GGDEF domain-containing protein [Halanaerobium congolense]|jgi:diguanylate cyclase (GGDEF)-like protein|uniref:Diguanylate cyclase (GGDEF)-like protein n=1 Tax=Halanaerobium congolense TaxID=54121 RepID=A0A4R7EFH0_9FIRM|nr:GGDEF domain-containing protein [Halanaerobium congolense]TDS32293.1 diguanylate cyclase (GGDEF)-like protein [Halanaerobium congolense]
MNRLFNKLKNIFAIIIILIILVSYFGVYLPLKNELEESLHAGFKSMVSNAEIILENHLNRASEVAAALSNRTMIGSEIEKYLNGEITFVELKNFTRDKYLQGAEVHDNLLAAYRYVDDRILAQYGEEYSWFLDKYDFDENSADGITITADQKYIIAHSKIENHAGENIGSDYIIYDLSAILLELNQLNSEEISYNISNTEPALESAVLSDKIVEIRELNDTDYFLKAETSTSLIYSTISRISYQIMLVIFATIIIISFLVIKILHNTSENIVKSLKKELKEKTILAENDKMLGIYNRSKFNKELQREMNRADRYNSKLSLIMIDIDYFKKFNDNYGHHVGDEVLKKIVEIVDSGIREHDILARYGGDEFMLICPETDLDEAEILAQKLNCTIDNYNYKQHNDLSCSFGVAEYKGRKDNSVSLVNRADEALYKAKRTGRNKVCRHFN